MHVVKICFDVFFMYRPSQLKRRLASPRPDSPRLASTQSEVYSDRGVLRKGVAVRGGAWLLGAAALSIFVWVDNN